jgi:hypothetical protein
MLLLPKVKRRNRNLKRIGDFLIGRSKEAQLLHERELLARELGRTATGIADRVFVTFRSWHDVRLEQIHPG